MTDLIDVVPYNAELQVMASSFHSGNVYLDSFLRAPVSLDDSYGKTYVWMSSDRGSIVGYYNIGTGYIEQIESGLHRKIGGSIHINCFALDEAYHNLLQDVTEDGTKINLSDVLLDECVQRIEDIRRTHVGFSFITLNSTKEGYSLYRRSGFDDLENDMNFSVEESDELCTPMYLALDYE